MAARMRLYSMPSSGNSYKVRLLLAHLGHSYEHVSCENGSDDLRMAKEEGLALFGKVPALKLETGEVIVESNAILCHLGRDSSWCPRSPLAQSRMLSWMFFEQNRHEPVIAWRASLRCYPHLRDQATPARLERLLQAGHMVLAVMERHLSRSDWFGEEMPSLADIALYAYTHTAGTRGGYDLGQYPGITAWIARFAALPGHIELDEIP